MILKVENHVMNKIFTLISQILILMTLCFAQMYLRGLNSNIITELHLLHLTRNLAGSI